MITAVLTIKTTKLILVIYNDLCEQRGGYYQGCGRIEVDSLLKRRGRTLAAWSVMLEILEDKEVSWFVGLEDDYPR